MLFGLSRGGTLKAAPVTLLDVSGAGDTGQTINADEAVAVSFTISATFDNVTVSSPLLCIGCTGGLTLIKNQIGPGASAGDVVASLNLDVNTTTPYFAPMTLDSGTYFLVASIDSGSAAWVGSSIPAVTEATNVTHGLDFVATTTDPFAPQSDYNVILGGSALHYTITSVPEPASFTALGAAFLTVAGVRGRRRRKLKTQIR